MNKEEINQIIQSKIDEISHLELTDCN
jgi:hypothetical protein